MTSEFESIVTAVDRAKDGDTAAYTIRVAPRLREDLVGRILGVDCPESRRPASDYEIAQSKRALALTREFITGPGNLWSRREMKTDSFGRELVTLWHELDGIRTDLAQALVDAQLATWWPLRWWQAYDPGGRPGQGLAQ